MLSIKTIKGWVNNSTNKSFQENLEKYKLENNLTEFSPFKNGFFSQLNKNKKRVIIKGWYWRGEWSNPTKETYCYLIEQ